MFLITQGIQGLVVGSYLILGGVRVSVTGMARGACVRVVYRLRKTLEPDPFNRGVGKAVIWPTAADGSQGEIF